MRSGGIIRGRPWKHFWSKYPFLSPAQPGDTATAGAMFRLLPTALLREHER